MPTRKLSPEPGQLWRSQAPEFPAQRLESMLARSFQSTIGLRNLTEYVAAGVVAFVFTGLAITATSPILQIGYGLAVAAAIYICIQLHLRGAARTPPSNGALSVLAFHRAELVRQRDALRSIWSWYLGPMIPSLVVVALGRILETPASWPVEVLSLALCGLLSVGVAHLNTVGARRLQADIDALDALASDEEETVSGTEAGAPRTQEPGPQAPG